MIRLMAILVFVTVSNWLKNHVLFRIAIWLCISLKRNIKVDRVKRLHIMLVLPFMAEVIIDN